MTNNTKQSLRLFYALWPDDVTRADLMRQQALIKGRKTSYGNLHLTLAFLGEQPVELLPIFKSILEYLPQQAFTLVLDRIGYFTQKKIAWSGMHESPAALNALHSALSEALVKNKTGFDRSLEFRPHVTLARNAESPEELPFSPIVWKCDHVALVESTNQPEGVVYRVLASYFLE
jgi:2'-5' RNA ligase